MQLAVHVSHHKVREGDRGLVVIGGSVSYGDLDDSDVAVDAEQDDALAQELQAEDAELLHARGGART